MVRNATNYPHLAAVLHGLCGCDLLVVIVKVSRCLSDGAAHPEPLPVHTSDVLFPSGAVRYPGELVPSKRGTDIVCNGHVYAPGGRPITTCSAELRVGDVRGEVRATGRRRTPDGEPDPFGRIPLGLEHAPGLAALGPGSEPRRRYRGTFDDVWQCERAPLLPEDMDERFWNAAQLTSARPLLGGESIVLVNLTPSGQMETTLPRMGVRARIEDRDVRPALDLVVIEPDEDRVTLTFRFAANVTGRLDGRMPRVRLLEKRRLPLGRRLGR